MVVEEAAEAMAAEARVDELLTFVVATVLLVDLVVSVAVPMRRCDLAAQDFEQRGDTSPRQ